MSVRGRDRRDALLHDYTALALAPRGRFAPTAWLTYFSTPQSCMTVSLHDALRPPLSHIAAPSGRIHAY
jgi:hypothetical protein